MQRILAYVRKKSYFCSRKSQCMANTFGDKWSFTSFGESHGVAIGGVLDGVPAGIAIDFDLIREELLKSCELTGIWEKKLRDIEHQKYDAKQFIDELKQQVTEIVHDVMADPSNRRITVLTDAELKKVKSPKKQ